MKPEHHPKLVREAPLNLRIEQAGDETLRDFLGGVFQGFFMQQMPPPTMDLSPGMTCAVNRCVAPG